MTREFTLAELIALSESEKAIQKAIQKDMGKTDPREVVVRAAQVRRETVQAMWQRIIAKMKVPQ